MWVGRRKRTPRTAYNTKRWRKATERQLNMEHKPEDFLCPRCGGLIPSNINWGEYPGAISRLTRADEDETGLEICSDCGQEEAIIQFTGNRLQEEDEFPIMTDLAMARRFDAIAIIDRHNDKIKRMARRAKIEGKSI